MFKTNNITVSTSLESVEVMQGETIEEKVERIVNNKEPIKDGAPPVFTERGKGVLASTNIRTDRFLIAIEAAEKIEKSYKARREEKEAKEVGKPESIDGKGETPTNNEKK